MNVIEYGATVPLTPDTFFNLFFPPELSGVIDISGLCIVTDKNGLSMKNLNKLFNQNRLED